MALKQNDLTEDLTDMLQHVALVWKVLFVLSLYFFLTLGPFVLAWWWWTG